MRDPSFFFLLSSSFSLCVAMRVANDGDIKRGKIRGEKNDREVCTRKRILFALLAQNLGCPKGKKCLFLPMRDKTELTMVSQSALPDCPHSLLSKKNCNWIENKSIDIWRTDRPTIPRWNNRTENSFFYFFFSPFFFSLLKQLNRTFVTHQLRRRKRERERETVFWPNSSALWFRQHRIYFPWQNSKRFFLGV